MNRCGGGAVSEYAPYGNDRPVDPEGGVSRAVGQVTFLASKNLSSLLLAPGLTSLQDLEQRLSGWAARSRRRSPKVNAQTASLIVPIDHHKDRRTPLIA
jgi:hypothetical protein